MANTVQVKRSGTASAAPTSLAFGELALNYADNKVFWKDASNAISSFTFQAYATAANPSVTNGFTVTNYSAVTVVTMRRALGTEASPSAITSTTAVANLTARAYDGTSYQVCGLIRFLTNGAVTSSDSAGYIRLDTTPSGSVTPAERVRITSEGNVGIGTISPTALLDVNSDTIRLRTARTPASATAAGNAGDICWDASYLYICTATDTWRRIAHASW